MALRGFVKTAIATLAATLGFIHIAAAHEGASGNGVSLLRDTEIEGDIHTMMTPIWKAAGLDPDAVHVYLVSDDSINSFVAGGQNIFINSGLLLHADTPNQLIGVLSHETGHIAGGHLYKGVEAMHNASIEEIIAMAAGVAATVAGRGSGGGGALLGAAGVGQRAYLGFSVTQEATADHAAMNYLDATHQSARGLLQFFEILQTQELLIGEHEDPYLMDHPLTQERIDYVRDHVEHSPYSDVADPPGHVEMLARIKVKLAAFTEPPTSTLAKYPEQRPLGSGALRPRHRLLPHPRTRQGAADDRRADPRISARSLFS